MYPIVHNPFVFRSRLGLPLHLQQPLLAVDPPAVSAHTSIFPNHAVTRNRHSHGIRRARTGYGTDRARLADGLGHLTVRFGDPERDRLQVRPDATLKCGGADVERQWRIEIHLLAGL